MFSIQTMRQVPVGVRGIYITRIECISPSMEIKLLSDHSNFFYCQDIKLLKLLNRCNWLSILDDLERCEKLLLHVNHVSFTLGQCCNTTHFKLKSLC